MNNDLWICGHESSLFCCDCREKLVTFQAGRTYRSDYIERFFNGHLQQCAASGAWFRWAKQDGIHLHPFQIDEGQAYDDTVPHSSNGPLEPFVRRLLKLNNWPGMEVPSK